MFVIYHLTVETGDSLQKRPGASSSPSSVWASPGTWWGALPGHDRCPRTSGVKPRSLRRMPRPEVRQHGPVVALEGRVCG